MRPRLSRREYARVALSSLLLNFIFLGTTFSQGVSPTRLGVKEANLLSNGDFEIWSREVGPPTDWDFIMGQSPTVLHRDTKEKKSGISSLRFDLGMPNNTGWISQKIGHIHPDTEYRISGFVKIGSDSKIPQRLVVIEPNLGGLTLPESTQWTAWELTFNSREAEALVPQFRFRGTGTVWLDDLQLVQVGKAGATVLPERRQILKLLEYQSHPVPPSTNTDAWTKPYCRPVDARKVFRHSHTATVPSWKVGQWARYVCRDDLLVPSRYREKQPHIMLIDCAIVGAEKIQGKTYYWYQSVVRLKRYWLARSKGLDESMEKILLGTPRQAVLSLLVEGQDFKDIRRYQLQIDRGPLLEYTDGERAVLPRMNIDHAMIRPGARFATVNTRAVFADVPVTGVLSFEYHGPQLDRFANLVNWGDSGARDERRGKTPTIIRLARAPYLAVAFDGFGDLKHYREMVAAGAELFQHQCGLYLGQTREYFNTMPAYFYNIKRWDADLFDICRSNLLGFSPHLDEPYQRQRKTNEYIKRGEVTSLTQAADRYSEVIAKLLREQPLWPGEEIMDYNSPASAAWYSARVGAAGFVLENARLPGEMADIERVTGKKEAWALSDAINIACLRGAARRFGIWWGLGIYRWVPERFWTDQLVNYVKQGARYVGFWIEGGPSMQDPDLTFYASVLKALSEIARSVKTTHPRPRQATVAIVVPEGYVLGLSGSAPEIPWGILDFPHGKEITDQVIAHAADLFDRGVVFDIVVDTPREPDALKTYAQIIRVF